MKKCVINPGTLLPALALLSGLVCTSTFAAIEDSWCDVTSGSITFNNVNLRGGSYSDNQELQRVSVPVTYTCYLKANISYPKPYQPTLRINNAFGHVVQSLKGSGLGLDLIVQEDGRDPVTIKWADLKNVTSVSVPDKGFGAPVYGGRTETTKPGTGRVELRLFVDSKFNSTLANFSVPGVQIANIMAYPAGGVPAQTKAGTPLNMNGFNIRIIPDNSGQVSASPSVVNLGSFYTEYKNSFPREVPFTVTAQQKIGTSSRPAFTSSLAIRFETNGLALTADNQSVLLHNDDGTPNGLKLSIKDTDKNLPVTLNTAMTMNEVIEMGQTATGSVKEHYMAVVEPAGGGSGPVKTGRFSVPMTVVVTYI